LSYDCREKNRLKFSALPSITVLLINMPAKIFNMPGKVRILWISDTNSAPDANIFEQLDFCSLEWASGRAEGLRRLRASGTDILLLSVSHSGWSPAEFVEEVQPIDSGLPVLIHDSGGYVTDASLATIPGAQIFAGPLDAVDLRKRCQAALETRAQARTAVPPAPWKHLLVGESGAIVEVDRIIRLVAPRRCTVLITGETGTGKEMAARAIHLASPRSSLPMVSVNCSALPENLLEAELFGHVRGAFTGAVQQRIGRFEQAHNSTLFLDEIGDMPLELQAKLLRVLQEREFQRLGSSETISVDVRVIAASNVDLEERVHQRHFREDLYYRLNVVPIPMPPLRERRSDIPALASHFVDKVCRMEHMPAKRISPEALARLSDYGWPGNVRQLENAIEMAAVLSGERSLLYPGDFPLPAQADNPAPTRATPTIPVPDDGLDFERTVSHIERSILEQALRKTRGNKKMAAEMLGLKRTTLSAKLRSLDAAG
jgi:DNA-binding NtrC family response regulator